jgi:hypothetical protein
VAVAAEFDVLVDDESFAETWRFRTSSMEGGVVTVASQLGMLEAQSVRRLGRNIRTVRQRRGELVETMLLLAKKQNSSTEDTIRACTERLSVRDGAWGKVQQTCGAHERISMVTARIVCSKNE